MLSDDSEAYEREKSFEITLHDSKQMQASDECIEDPLKKSGKAPSLPTPIVPIWITGPFPDDGIPYMNIRSSD